MAINRNKPKAGKLYRCRKYDPFPWCNEPAVKLDDIILIVRNLSDGVQFLHGTKLKSIRWSTTELFNRYFQEHYEKV